MAVATIAMTAARGKLIDYIIPYFENSGISISKINIKNNSNKPNNIYSRMNNFS